MKCYLFLQNNPFIIQHIYFSEIFTGRSTLETFLLLLCLVALLFFF